MIVPFFKTSSACGAFFDVRAGRQVDWTGVRKKAQSNCAYFTKIKKFGKLVSKIALSLHLYIYRIKILAFYEKVSYDDNIYSD